MTSCNDLERERSLHESSGWWRSWKALTTFRLSLCLHLKSISSLRKLFSNLEREIPEKICTSSPHHFFRERKKVLAQDQALETEFQRSREKWAFLTPIDLLDGLTDFFTGFGKARFVLFIPSVSHSVSFSPHWLQFIVYICGPTGIWAPWKIAPFSSLHWEQSSFPFDLFFFWGFKTE